jgi:hypothetical protein
MFASRFLRTASVAAAVGAALVLSTASYAASYDQLFPARSYSAPHSSYQAPGHSFSRSRAYYGIGIPNDYSSSHVCIGGYRWITRELDASHTPEQTAIPVRC